MCWRLGTYRDGQRGTLAPPPLGGGGQCWFGIHPNSGPSDSCLMFLVKWTWALARC